jgi:hypothetical protein
MSFNRIEFDAVKILLNDLSGLFVGHKRYFEFLKIKIWQKRQFQ